MGSCFSLFYLLLPRQGINLLSLPRLLNHTLLWYRRESFANGPVLLLTFCLNQFALVLSRFEDKLSNCKLIRRLLSKFRHYRWIQSWYFETQKHLSCGLHNLLLVKLHSFSLKLQNFLYFEGFGLWITNPDWLMEYTLLMDHCDKKSLQSKKKWTN